MLNELMRFYFLILIAVLSMSCNETQSNSNNRVDMTNNANSNVSAAKFTEYDYEIVKTYPHDPKAFTQGLDFHKGFLYEGTGGSRARGDNFYSSLRKVEIETGKVLQKFDLPDEYFGEGITILNDKIYQLTWHEQTAFVYDLNDFKLLKEFRYSGEGWGLTNDGTNLIMTDRTHVIRFINPENFELVRTLAVFDEKRKPVMELNELEYINGEIWANIWQKDDIVRINPANGNILGRINFEKLVENEMKNSLDADVLNGIAYDEATNRIFITGKRWKRLFEIKIKPKS
jgi:glutamine cyclotransferase